MKKIIIASIALLSLASFKSLGDACETLSYFKEGTVTTMTSYDDKDAETGKTVTSYQKVTATDKGTNVTASQENFDKKGKSVSKNDFIVRCESGTLFFDMKMFIPQQQMQAYKDMEMTVEGGDMEFPTTITEGMSLKDAKISIKVSSKGTPMPMMNFSITMSNRKVEKKESITTPAGTFECYKLTEDMLVDAMIDIKMKSVSWFSPEAGVIKTESYKENGKFMGKSQLTELKK